MSLFSDYYDMSRVDNTLTCHVMYCKTEAKTARALQLSAGESTGDTSSEGGSSNSGTSNTEAIVVLRVLRVVRVLKLARHSKGECLLCNKNYALYLF